jgi:hypothetical protein
VPFFPLFDLNSSCAPDLLCLPWYLFSSGVRWIASISRIFPKSAVLCYFLMLSSFLSSLIGNRLQLNIFDMVIGSSLDTLSRGLSETLSLHFDSGLRLRNLSLRLGTDLKS